MSNYEGENYFSGLCLLIATSPQPPNVALDFDEKIFIVFFWEKRMVLKYIRIVDLLYPK